MSRIVAIHGFLGSPDQWDTLKTKHELIPLDLYQFDSIKELEEKVNKLSPSILMGYSLGGRIALHLATTMINSLERVYIFAGNIGPCTQSERAKRVKWESSWQNKLNTLTNEQFLQDWNSQPIFKHDLPITHLPHPKDKLEKLFNLYPLSKQPNFKELVEGEHKFTFVVGEKDTKYLQRYRKLKLTNLLVMKNCGHRLLNTDNIQKLSELLK